MLDLLSLGSGGVLDFVMQDFHELSCDGLGSLGDGRPCGAGVVGFAHEGTQLFKVQTCSQDCFSEGVKESGHGGGLNEHGLDLDSLREEPEIVVTPKVVEQVEDRNLVDWYVCNANPFCEAVSFAGSAKWVLFLKWLGMANGGVKVMLVGFPSCWCGW